MPDPKKFLKVIGSGGAANVVKESEMGERTPTYSTQFTRPSYHMRPKPPTPPKPVETGKVKEKLNPLPQKESLKKSPTPRPDLERIEETVEKANNDLNVIENYSNNDDDSNSGFNPYKDFGGG